MGVRFECPQGHKLHVKAELAGRRGICPECGIKFIVPSSNGGRVAADNGTAHDSPSSHSGSAREATWGGSAAPTIHQRSPAGDAEDAASSIIIPNAPAAAPPLTQPALGGEPSTGAEPVAWYVRPPAGGQFGPAPTEVFREWIAGGRVAAESWVWRTGWVDWRPGAEAIATLAELAPPLVATGAESGLSLQLPAVEPTSAADLPRHEVSTAEARRAEMRRRRQKNRAIALILGVVALVMAVVMAIVLNR